MEDLRKQPTCQVLPFNRLGEKAIGDGKVALELQLTEAHRWHPGSSQVEQAHEIPEVVAAVAGRGEPRRKFRTTSRWPYGTGLPAAKRPKRLENLQC